MKLKNSVFLIAMFVFASIALAQSHMGVPPEDFVTLEAHCKAADDVVCTEAYPLSRTYPDGSGGSVPYVIPEGKLLVVTDVNWRWTTIDLDDARIGHHMEVFLRRDNLANSSLSNEPFTSSATISRTLCASPCVGAISATGDVEMTTGFIVGSEAKLAYSVNDTGSFGLVLIIRGYLLPDERRR